MNRGEKAASVFAYCGTAFVIYGTFRIATTFGFIFLGVVLVALAGMITRMKKDESPND